MALGHIHVPQLVANNQHIRYSGSPIAMGFGEAKQQKILLSVEFVEKTPEITKIDVPKFQELVQIKGDWAEIEQQLTQLKEQNSHAWLEITYSGAEHKPDLIELINQILEFSNMLSLRIKNIAKMQSIMQRKNNQETLADLDEFEVFNRRLDSAEANAEISADQRPQLIQAYSEIIQSIRESDINATTGVE